MTSDRDRALYLAGMIGAAIIGDLCPDCLSPLIQATKQEMPFCGVCVERKLSEMQQKERELRKTLGIVKIEHYAGEAFIETEKPDLPPPTEPKKSGPDWGEYLRRKSA